MTSTCSTPSSSADLAVSVSGDDGEILARAELWWSDVPALPGHQVGCLGAFEATDQPAASIVLSAALDHLQNAGCTCAIGPMNGNTWRAHRFVVDDSGEPPFFLEPRNPPDYPAWFCEAGFRTLSTYSSSLIRLDADPGPDLTRVAQRLRQRGYRFRDLNLDRFHDELDAIYDLCMASFTGNFLYTPISRREFVTAYAAVRSLIDPSLVRIAECDGNMTGFLFAFPDPAPELRRVVLKTLAVHPHHRAGGLGSVLVGQVQERGRKIGFAQAIHALQHESNSSLRITGRHDARLLRRYALYARQLVR